MMIMTDFDYTGPAELFARKSHGAMIRSPMVLHRFSSGAEALRFAIETLAPQLLSGAILEIGEQRYGHLTMRKLYESAAYPLQRNPAAAPQPRAMAIENIQVAMAK